MYPYKENNVYISFWALQFDMWAHPLNHISPHTYSRLLGQCILAMFGHHTHQSWPDQFNETGQLGKFVFLDEPFWSYLGQNDSWHTISVKSDWRGWWSNPNLGPMGLSRPSLTALSPDWKVCQWIIGWLTKFSLMAMPINKACHWPLGWLTEFSLIVLPVDKPCHWPLGWLTEFHWMPRLLTSPVIGPLVDWQSFHWMPCLLTSPVIDPLVVWQGSYW